MASNAAAGKERARGSAERKERGSAGFAVQVPVVVREASTGSSERSRAGELGWAGLGRARLTRTIGRESAQRKTAPQRLCGRASSGWGCRARRRRRRRRRDARGTEAVQAREAAEKPRRTGRLGGAMGGAVVVWCCDGQRAGGPGGGPGHACRSRDALGGDALHCACGGGVVRVSSPVQVQVQVQVQVHMTWPPTSLLLLVALVLVALDLARAAARCVSNAAN